MVIAHEAAHHLGYNESEIDQNPEVPFGGENSPSEVRDSPSSSFAYQPSTGLGQGDKASALAAAAKYLTAGLPAGQVAVSVESPLGAFANVVASSIRGVVVPSWRSVMQCVNGAPPCFMVGHAALLALYSVQVKDNAASVLILRTMPKPYGVHGQAFRVELARSIQGWQVTKVQLESES